MPTYFKCKFANIFNKFTVLLFILIFPTSYFTTWCTATISFYVLTLAPDVSTLLYINSFLLAWQEEPRSTWAPELGPTAEWRALHALFSWNDLNRGNTCYSEVNNMYFLDIYVSALFYILTSDHYFRSWPQVIIVDLDLHMFNLYSV